MEIMMMPLSKYLVLTRPVQAALVIALLCPLVWAAEPWKFCGTAHGGQLLCNPGFVLENGELAHWRASTLATLAAEKGEGDSVLSLTPKGEPARISMRQSIDGTIFRNLDLLTLSVMAKTEEAESVQLMVSLRYKNKDPEYVSLSSDFCPGDGKWHTLTREILFLEEDLESLDTVYFNIQIHNNPRKTVQFKEPRAWFVSLP